MKNATIAAVAALVTLSAGCASGTEVTTVYRNGDICFLENNRNIVANGDLDTYFSIPCEIPQGATVILNRTNRDFPENVFISEEK
jgi:hypothetical protein